MLKKNIFCPKNKVEITNSVKNVKEKATDMIEQIIEQINGFELEYAIESINKYEEETKDYESGWILRGMVALTAQEYDVASECFKSCIAINSNNIDAYYNLAYLYEKMKLLDKALVYYKRIILLIDDIEEQKRIEKIICGIEEQMTFDEADSEIIIKDTLNKRNDVVSEKLCVTRENISKLILDEDAPLVSVVVTAYNCLERYTKKCIECLIKYTKNVDYELILLDNGSSDGTLEFFKSVKYKNKKIIRVTNNIGACYGQVVSINEFRGKYLVFLPNDVWVTENWLLNMVRCAESDCRIGMVTPQADYVSNFQEVKWSYDSFDDMQKKAAAYNVSDPTKWEERLRIITLGSMYRKACLDVIGAHDYGFMHDFSDDDISFRIRRAGYKTILCKDVFVSHVGKITDKGNEYMLRSMEKGRADFKEKYFGIDAWDDVINFEQVLLDIMQMETFNKKEQVNILGINVLCGTPILECKNRLRNNGSFDVILNAFSTEAKYWLDLKTICEGKVEVDRLQYIDEHFEPNSCDVIIIGEEICRESYSDEILNKILNILKPNGQLLMKVENNYGLKQSFKLISSSKTDEEKCKKLQREIDRVHQLLEDRNAKIIDYGTINLGEKPDVIQKLCDLAKKTGWPEESVKIIEAQSDVLRYLLNVSK